MLFILRDLFIGVIKLQTKKQISVRNAMLLRTFLCWGKPKGKNRDGIKRESFCAVTASAHYIDMVFRIHSYMSRTPI